MPLGRRGGAGGAGPYLSEGQQVLLLLLQVPLALLDELVHGWGALGWRDGCRRGQRGLGQGRQGRSRFQLRGLLLADDWQERRRGSPCEEAAGVQVSPWRLLGQLPSVYSPPSRELL